MLNPFSGALKIALVFGSAIIVGCTSSGQSDDSQKKYNKEVSKQVLIYMDIETMFPSAKLRELAKAAGKGNTSEIDKLMSEGADINSRGVRNATALFWAMRNKKGFNYLLAKGADPNVIFDDGGSVMHWAARNDDCSLLVCALKNGGNPNLKAGMFGGSPAFATVTAGNNSGVPECLKVLLTSNADIEFKDEKGKTLLLYAADLARFDIVLFLLDKGADATVEDNNGKNMRSILDSYKGAFNKGSPTELNWIRLKERLDKLGV